MLSKPQAKKTTGIVPQNKIEIKFPLKLNTKENINLLHQYFKQENFKTELYKQSKRFVFQSKDLELFELEHFSKLPNAQANLEIDKYSHRDTKYLCLSAETPKIVLKGIDLGKFKLKFTYKTCENYSDDPKKRESVCSPYILGEALTPNPSQYNDEVTHPNIEDENICLGEVNNAVTNALGQFRFSDAFELTVNMLKNVSNSPYVHIDEWGGYKCKNCGETHDDEYNIGECEYCRKNVCDGCAEQCNNCHDNELVHGNCLKTCHECKRSICERCLIKSRYNYGECCWERCETCDKPMKIGSNCSKCYKPEKPKKVVQAKPVVTKPPKGKIKIPKETNIIDLDPIY